MTRAGFRAPLAFRIRREPLPLILDVQAQQHRERRTNADKRKAVVTLLRDEEWGKWNDSEIARRVVVERHLVAKVRSELAPSSLVEVPSEERSRMATTKHGTVTQMNVSNIGRGQKPSALPTSKKKSPAARAPKGQRGGRRGFCEIDAWEGFTAPSACQSRAA